MAVKARAGWRMGFGALACALLMACSPKYDWRTVHSSEGAYAVADLAIRYRAPAHLDDALLVVSRVATVRAASVVIHQTVRRGPLVLTEAEVTAALVAANGRPRRQPAAWTDIYQRLVWQGTNE